ncbi:hypothetical protein FLJC2902T_13380 [Flavobacterium limnosediminis JC2902]|uniref:Peptidase S9 prolyl oligopeptidase catalytic domain-containing protein n=1 Tax=Flavobacterium limnosediminis JC2902 TaxID=1341181 RepID=V6SQM3_9FLAO|nr:prolyl oligopeptidase family serine peptidase [Flavobacterium limnosediminis]ESU28744.1 hypothetical protein FLJC2902T_13380 [Flavobacterium limnosediminis JC2902]
MKNKANYSFIWFGLVFLLQVGYGQPAKRCLSLSDYDKLCQITNNKLSANGNWASYKLQYDNGVDTIVVQNTNSNKKLLFPSATDITFSDNEKWVIIKNAENKVLLQSLDTNQSHEYQSVTQSEFILQNKWMVVLSKTNDVSNLILKNLTTGKEIAFNGVTQYTLSKKGKIAVANDTLINLIDPDENFQSSKIVSQSNGRFKKMLWSNSGNKLAIVQQQNQAGLLRPKHSLYCYTDKNKVTIEIDHASKQLENQIIVTPLGIPSVSFSKDENTLFFYRSSPVNKTDKDTVEVWDASTPLEYPMQEYHGNPDFLPKLTAWSLTDNTIKEVATNTLPQSRLLPGGKKAILFNKLDYEPQIEFAAPANFYITDIQSGAKWLFLEKYTTAIAVMGASPNGQFINYFRDKHWWIYDTEKNKHFNLTAKLNTTFSDGERHEPGDLPPYGNPGWSVDGKYLIIYDQYDTWLLPVNGQTPQRITLGRESEIKFSIFEDNPQGSELNTNYYNLSDGLFLMGKAENMDSGWFKWMPNKSVDKITYKAVKTSCFRKALNSDKYSWIEESIAVPPRLMFSKNGNGAEKTVYQSNEKYKNYDWGKSTLVSYKTAFNDSLQGVLYYPANYQEGKKYPMIVYIYEKLSDRLHNFERPVLAKEDGFPLANYLQDDYLVLLPDISYQIGKPGNSALECVTAAVESVKSLGVVNQNKMGLIGHSFGGYEVAYIISKSNLFATAVQGSGIIDFINYYLSMHWETEHSNMWRFETGQQRMEKPLYDDFNAYLANSPIAQAAGINTPLLSWSGKADKNVNYNQSMALHLALRRLGRKNVFLVYPEEPHILLNKKNQIDLTARIHNWFNTYLK